MCMFVCNKTNIGKIVNVNILYKHGRKFYRKIEPCVFHITTLTYRYLKNLLSLFMHYLKLLAYFRKPLILSFVPHTSNKMCLDFNVLNFSAFLDCEYIQF
jgi:hypothetical protein